MNLFEPKCIFETLSNLLRCPNCRNEYNTTNCEKFGDGKSIYAKASLRIRSILTSKLLTQQLRNWPERIFRLLSSYFSLKPCFIAINQTFNQILIRTNDFIAKYQFILLFFKLSNIFCEVGED